MKLRLPIIAGAALVTVSGATLFGVSAVSAEESGESLASRIANRFSLNRDEVDEVVGEFREERQQLRQANRESKMDDRLSGLVEDGTITAEQKELLQAKLEENQQAREEIRDQDLDAEERHEQMESIRDSFEAWAEENNIDLGDLPGPGEKMRGQGMGQRGQL